MIGAGTKFQVTPDDGTTWQDVSEIKELSFPEETRETSEDSYIDSVDFYKEFVSGMVDSGEMSITLKWKQDDTQQIALNADFEGDGQPKMYQVLFTNGAKFTFDAVVTKRGLAVPKNETITQNFSFKLSGKPTWVPA